MAKELRLTIDRFQAASLFSAVRSKRDVILLWMKAIKSFLISQPAEAGQAAATLTISVTSMSRLFCEIEDGRKIFSIAFPFSMRLPLAVGGEVTFHSREGVTIDNRVSSEVIALVEGGEVLDAPDFSSFVDPIIDATDSDPEIWTLLKELILAEDGYVRYDWDVERANGHLHPEHHIDFCYSSSSSFKIGLHTGIDRGALLSILDVETDCHYLSQAGASSNGAGRR